MNQYVDGLREKYGVVGDLNEEKFKPIILELLSSENVQIRIEGMGLMLGKNMTEVAHSDDLYDKPENWLLLKIFEMANRDEVDPKNLYVLLDVQRKSELPK